MIRNLAVLPFANTSGDRQDDFFSDGLTDELTHALANLPGLWLAGRTSSYAFKRKAAAAASAHLRLRAHRGLTPDTAYYEREIRRSAERRAKRLP